ncbi:MAG: hypothetical protein JJU08_14465 [Rhodobacteraceae bacterium]|nr:hypothetical protein [Paracoccaceae bacterium]
MRDETPRLHKIGDALSQLGNVSFLPDHRATTANESISGRAHRMGWRVEWWIDLPFRLFGQRHHCLDAYNADLERAAAFKAQHRERAGMDH